MQFKPCPTKSCNGYRAVPGEKSTAQMSKLRGIRRNSKLGSRPRTPLHSSVYRPIARRRKPGQCHGMSRFATRSHRATPLKRPPNGRSHAAANLCAGQNNLLRNRSSHSSKSRSRPPRGGPSRGGPSRPPPDRATASEFSDVDNRIVNAGGVTTANFPHAARNLRRSSSGGFRPSALGLFSTVIGSALHLILYRLRFN
jgi:hypothetical protein